MMKRYTATLLLSFLTTALLSQPVIQSFSPSSGTIGTTVTIKGSGFIPVASSNIVYFGAVRANVTGSTDTTVIVTVPAGASYQPISVTVNNLTAYTTNPFMETFAGGAGPFVPGSFLPKSDFTTGMYPHSVAMADFNQDGKVDILVSRGSSSNVSILPNTSTASVISFGSQISLPATGTNHEGAAIADFDGDGKLDFVITNSTSNSVSIFQNTSTSAITFAPKFDLPADNSPYAVACGDLDGDGKPDLVLANNGTSDKVCVYRNTSSGGNITFGVRQDFTVGTNPYGVAIGDLDGDGKPELAVTTQGTSTALFILKNTSSSGTISFNPAMNIASISGPFVVAIGDLDNDNRPDIAVASAGSTIAVLKNSSSSGIISFGSVNYFNTGSYNVCVAIADLDGDGLPDLISSNRMGNSVSCLRNITNGTYINFDNHVDYSVGADPFYVAAADLDGDARPDIIAANSSATTVSVLRNIIGANIAPVITSFTPTSGINGTIVTILGSNFTGASMVRFGGIPAAFTVDSSHGITAMVGAGASGDVSVTTPNGTATLAGFTFNGPIISSFTPVVGITGTVVSITGSNLNGATSVKFGGTPASSFTINSSQNISAVVGTGSSGTVSVTTPNGTAALDGFSYGAPTITSFTPVSAAAGSTVVITGENFNPVASQNTVYFGAVKANITSATSTQLSVTAPAGATYQPITVTTNNLTAYSPKMFNPTFASDTPHITTSLFASVGGFGTGSYPVDIASCDFDGDGKPDLVTANANANTISVLKNMSTSGTIAFNPKIDYTAGLGPRRIAIGDLDGDSKPDLLLINFNAGNASTMSVYRNNSSPGTVSFESPWSTSTGNGTLGISIGDINGDGKPDVVVASGNSGIFSIYKNTTSSVGNISFAPRQDYSVPGHADQVIVTDVDLDGRPDVILSGFSNMSISVYRNVSSGGNIMFDSPMNYVVGSNPSYMRAVDVNADGITDLVVTVSGTLTALINTSVPGSISLATAVTFGSTASNSAAIDLNGDGKPEITSGRASTGLISVYENNTTPLSGQFIFAPGVDFTAGNFDDFVSVGDLDGDGRPELATANTTLNNVVILRNTANDPLITTLSNSSASTGTAVTINGRHFAGTTAVKFGGTAAASFAVISPTRIDAVVAGGASGNISVTNVSGTSSFAGFNFIPVITSGGATTFCNGESIVLTSSAAANNQWYKDAAVINSATATTLQVTTAGSYTVKTTSNGITTTSNAIVISVTTIPQPVITLSGNNQLVSSATNGNQWYWNGNIISGATDQAYQPTQNGNYTVMTTSGGCTSAPSAAFIFSLTGVIDLGNNQYVKIFPNPVTDRLYLSWNINGSPLLNIEISDLQGRSILTRNNITSGTPILISYLPTGIYFVKISNQKLKINGTARIVKQN